MKIWPVLTVGLVGLLAHLLVLGWPFVQMLAPGSPMGELVRVVETVATVADLRARVIVKGEGEVEAEVLYAQEPAVRVELLSPAELRGEVYTGRKVSGGWLLVHYRPEEETGIEIRPNTPPWEEVALGIEDIRQAVLERRVAVVRGEDGGLEVVGRLSIFRRGLIRLDPKTGFPTWMELLVEMDGRELTVIVSEITLNPGLELRDILALPAQPRTWIQS